MHGCTFIGRGVAPLRLIALALLLAAMAASPATAQGTRGVLPDPISAGDIDRYAHLLELSAAQREAVDHIHEGYLDRFHALRDGPIERFLQAYPKAVSYYADVPKDPAEAEPVARELKRLCDRIRQLDDSFFTRVQEILGPEQLSALPRARDARTRTRYRQGSAWITASAYLQTDLGILFDELDLTDEQREAALPMVQGYERKLAGALKKLNDATSSLQVEMGRLRIAVTEAAEEPLYWVDAHVLRALFDRLSSLAADVGAAHRQAVEQWRTVLPPAAMDALQRNYHRAVYAEVPPGYGPAAILFPDLASDEALSAGQHEAIAGAEALYRQSAHRVKNQMLDVIDAMRISTANHPLQFSWGGGGADYYEEPSAYTGQLKPLRGRLDEINQSAATSLSEITGRQLEAARIATEAEKEPGESMTVGSMGGGGGPSHYFYSGIPLEQLTLQFGAGATHFLPGPISQGELRRYARRLGLDENDEAVLAGVHESYLDQFRQLGGDGPVGRVRRLQATLFQRDATGRIEIPTVEKIDDLFALRRKAVQAILERDRSFHDDLALIWTEETEKTEIDRLAQRRLRMVYRCGGPGEKIPHIRWPLFIIAHHEERAPRDAESVNIELDALLERVEEPLDSALRAELQLLLAQAESKLTEMLGELLDARFGLEHERARIMAEYLKHEDAGTFSARRVPASAAMIEFDEQIHRLLIDVRDLNRTTRDALALRLPASARWTLLAGYRRAGHPGLFAETLCASHALAAARQLEDINDEQRRELGELARAYAAEDETLCERIIATLDDRQARDRHESERKDLYDRTWARLRALLSDEQIAMVEVLSRMPPR